MAASSFSYAQAAKGMSTPVGATKADSGSVTPPKESVSVANGSVASVQSWADDAETETSNDQPTSTQEAQPQEPASKPVQSAQPVETSSISSPDLGASSASTVTKDDDVSSLPNASSESTWDNKSQASTSVEKSADPAEKTSEKVKKGKNTVVKPLLEAPLPAVNIWKQRADEAKAKASKPTAAPSVKGTLQGATGASAKKSDVDVKGRPRTHDEERNTHGRREAKGDADARRESKGKPNDRDSKQTSSGLPPPPNRDQESWPTPETAIDEERKKAQEKGEKVDKERKESIPTASHGKHEWVKVPYTPTVVFSTPLPNAGNTRRGGRSGGRGGAQPGGRSTGPAANGAVQSEKDGSVSVAVSNGEQPRRDGAAPREASPKSKRAGGATSPSLQGEVSAVTGEKPSKPIGPSTSTADVRPRGTSTAADASQLPSQNNSLPRQYAGRPNKPRRGDFANTSERRRDGDASPTKDNTLGERHTSAATQTDVPEDGERRAYDGPNGQQHKQGRYGSYSGGRERGRGGARGGRGNFVNGHQYANSHGPSAQSSSFPLGPRSPTTFNPEHPSYYPATQGKYGRNGHRSQSVTSDAYRFAPYHAGPPVPPLQTYNMYDYNVMQQPMSAVPYTPYVDQFALFSLITTQVDYYFSVDNLLKDMFLRRQMDSQGFVSLDFIAGFNRIKQLSTDVELLKLVCQQSAVVEYRTGEDGQDRLRRREGWEQWVLKMGDRDEKAQNDGPKELHVPAIPQPTGFEQGNQHQWPMSAVAPTVPYDGAYPYMNGLSHSAEHDNTFIPANAPNGTSTEGTQNGTTNGHSAEKTIEACTKRAGSEGYVPDQY